MKEICIKKICSITLCIVSSLYALKVSEFVNRSALVNEGELSITQDSKNALNATQGKHALNLGVIRVTGDSLYGVQAINGGFGENRGQMVIDAGRFTSAMKAVGSASSVVNYGEISHRGNGKDTSNAMLAQQGGVAENFGNIIVSGKGTSGMNASELGSRAINQKSGKISVKDSAYGIKIDKSAYGENQGLIELLSNNTIGIFAIGGSGDSVLALNTGKILITAEGSSGMAVTQGGKIENRGLLDVKAGKFTSAMKAQNQGSEAKNFGQIIHQGDGNNTSNAMLAQNSGAIENFGEISVSGKNASAMNASGEGSQAFNAKEGKIIVKDSAFGLKIDKSAHGENQGLITLTANNTIGINVVGEAGQKPTATNMGRIDVVGDGSSGMSASKGGAVTNRASVVVKAGRFTSAMRAQESGSSAINAGEILHYGDNVNTSNAMLAQNGGIVTNYGNMRVVYRNTSALSASGAQSVAYNADNASIIAQDLANGAKIENQAKGVNRGLIQVERGSAVTLNNAMFLNDGGRIEGETIAKSLDNTKNVFAINGGSMQGKIQGGNGGVDLLYLAQTNQDLKLIVQGYEALFVYQGTHQIQSGIFELLYEPQTQSYLQEIKAQTPVYPQFYSQNTLVSNGGILELNHATLIINLKDALNQNKKDWKFVEAQKLIIAENSGISFVASDGRESFNLKEIFGETEVELRRKNSAIWTYHQEEGGIIATKQKYQNALLDNKLSSFAQMLDERRSSGGSLNLHTMDAEHLQNKAEFTRALAQLSGSLHGQMIDIASTSSNKFANQMIDMATSNDFSKSKVRGKTIQEIIYYESASEFLASLYGSYRERGAFGINERSLDQKSKLGLMFGGTLGRAKFDEGRSGEAKVDNIYVGGYYVYDFSKNFSLISNLRVHSAFNTITRKIDYRNTQEQFSVSYPIYSLGTGMMGRYTYLKDAWRLSVFAGLDYTRLTQGNIKEDQRPSAYISDLAISATGSVDEQTYNSVLFKTGFQAEFVGYVFDKKYLIGTTLQYETDFGDINQEKQLKLQGLPTKHSFQTAMLKDMFEYNLYARLFVTQDFLLTNQISGILSKEYSSYLFMLGLGYRFDSLGTLIESKISSSPKKDSRWRGSVGIFLETEDDSDRLYFNSQGEPTSGDYVTSTWYMPKLVFSLRDLQTKLTYYFEGYYADNEMIQGLKKNEAKQYATRLHFEVRWGDSIGRFRHGYSIVYRNEMAKKPLGFGRPTFQETQGGIHQLRFTPSLSYGLGKGFFINGNFTGMWQYNYLDRRGQNDFLLESLVGVVYNGLMPRISFGLSWFRGDRWYDKRNDVDRYVLNQLRPTIRYYFGDGGSVELEVRIPMLNGEYYRNTQTQKARFEAHEMRYGFKYTQPLFAGLTGVLGVTMLNITGKIKETNTQIKYHSFRTLMGLNYNF